MIKIFIKNFPKWTRPRFTVTSLPTERDPTFVVVVVDNVRWVDLLAWSKKTASLSLTLTRQAAHAAAPAAA